jgi:amino acid adenylation domain-containing protein
MDSTLKGIPTPLTPNHLSVEEKRALAKKLLIQKMGKKESEFPLSNGQEALWSLYRNHPTNSTYNEGFAVKIVSGFEEKALKRSFQRLVNRHPALRSCFFFKEALPYQRVQAYQEVAFHTIDASTWSTDQLQQEVKTAFDQPFALEDGAVFRVHLFRCNEAEAVLLVSIHHIVCDGWSMNILLQEFLAAYKAEIEHTDPQWEPLHNTYADFVKEQQQILDSAAGKRQWGYWKKQLAGELPVTDLPLDHTRAAFRSEAGAEHSFRINSQLSRQLKQLAKTEGTSLFTTLLASFQALLFRYSDQTDLISGIPAANRGDGQWASTIGYFVNPLPIRSAFTSDLRFSDSLRDLHATLLNALEHQEYPFPSMVEQLNLPPAPSHDAVFQTFFYLQGQSQYSELNELLIPCNDGYRVDLEHLSFEQFDLPNKEGRFDLSLECIEGKKGLTGIFRYNSDLFEPTTIERLVAHYTLLLESIVQDPQEKIGALNMLSQEEKSHILQTFATTSRPFPDQATFAQLFQAQAQQFPTNTALQCEDRSLSYQALNEKANQLAHLLKDQYKLGPETVVGLMMERSEWYVLSMLAVLKADSAFLPIAPNLPPERIRFMLEQTEAKVLIGHQEISLDDCPCPCFVIEDNKEALSQASNTNMTSTGSNRQLAYIIYTSGSTGAPKGVMIEQIGMINHLYCKINDLEMDDATVLVQNASISFDISVWQSLAALLVGGKTLVYTQELVLAPQRFIQSVARDQATVLEVVPSYLSELLAQLEDAPQNAGWSKLSYLMTTGETIQKNLVKRWFELFPTIKLVNAYGPTEASDDITHHIMEQASNLPAIPIGKAVQNLQVYILNDQLEICPIGIKGEICVAGVGVGRGYLGDAEKTAKAFCDDPFSNGTAQKLYKTGDIGCYLPQGDIAFFGRKDNQVKIRGHRIELGEIEAKLSQIPAIRDGAVVVKKDQKRDDYLCAYVSLRKRKSQTEAELKSALKDKLPFYMVPSHIILLDSLPLTPNGKVNRRLLSIRQEKTNSTGTDAHQAPATLTEQTLQKIWEQVLATNPISTAADFFTMGGHSLKIIRIQALIQKHWGIDINFREFFTHKTIQSLAQFIDQVQQKGQAPIPVAATATHYPVSPGQKHLWLFSHFHQNQHAYSIAGAFEIKGQLNRNALETAFRMIVERHESLRTNFRSKAGIPYQVIHAPEDISLNMEWIDIQQSPHPKGIYNEQLNSELRRPFDLEHDALVRLRIWQLGLEEARVLFSFHHIIADAWSLQTFTKEFMHIYEQCCLGQAINLPPLTIQYKDYSSWLDKKLKGQQLQESRKYWARQFEAPLPTLEVPTDFPRPSARSFDGASLYIPMATEQIEGLRQLAQEQKATLFMSFLSSIYAFLSRLSGQEDIILGTTIAGRAQAELQQQIGFYVNTLALRTQFSAREGFSDLLKKTKESVLGAFEHQDYPFEQVLEEVNVAKDPSRSPLFDVFVELLEGELNAAEQLQLKDSSVARYPINNQTSKFDLSFRLLGEKEGYTLHVEYDTHLYTASRINRMVEQYQVFLKAITQAPRQPIAQLGLLPEQEYTRLLQWGEQLGIPLPFKSLKAMLEKAAEQYPERDALSFNGRTTNFATFNQKANHIAKRLQEEFNIRPNDVVAVLAEKSDDLIFSMAGIIKSGAAFLTIDPNYPIERIAYILEDSGAKLMMTDTSKIFDISLQFNKPFPAIFWMSSEEYKDDVRNPSSIVQADDLAYLLYTSGSTGQPKGVEITQSNIEHYLTWANQYYFDNQPGYPMPLFTSISFDLTMTSIFSTLLRGDTLYICPDDQSIDQTLEAIFSDDSPIRAIKLTPSHTYILKHLPIGKTNISKAIVGGEALTAEHTASLFALNPLMKVYNEYGPTEMTVGCTVECLQAGEDNISIGRPIDRTVLYILNPQHSLCPIGVPGEIYIGGAGLTKGYRDRAALNTKKFIDNPFTPSISAQLYKTGDIGKWGEDGKIQFLGRTDDQIKIRGYRVELGEIESQLLQLDSVKEAAVIAVEENGVKELAAYVVLGNSQPMEAIKRQLSKQLPNYLIPAFWVTREDLPLTNHGKVDKEKLKKINWKNTGHTVAEEALDEWEEALMEIWKNVLGLEKIGIDDNFFEFGGHSLRAIQILMSIQSKFGVDLALQDLFNHQTIKEQAEQVKSALRAKVEAIPLAPQQVHYELSNAQRRVWIIHQLEEQLAAYNIAAACILDGPLMISAFQQALEVIIERHESLRTIFEAVDGKPRQKIRSAKDIREQVEVIDLTAEDQPMDRAKEIAEEEANHVFKLEAGPLYRLRLLKIEEGKHVFLFTIHHIIADGWSLEILARELFQLHDIFHQGLSNPLEPLPIQYKDFAKWQNDLLRDAGLEKHQNYWLDHLGGTLPVLQIPTDFPRPKIKTFASRTFDFTLDKKTTEGLRAIAQAEKTSLFSILFTGIVSLLHRYSGQEEIILGTPVSGREHFSLKDQVGLFLNTLPIKVGVNAEDSFMSLVKKTKQRLLEAYEHQLYPFDRLVDDLHLNRDLSRSPLFDVLIVSTDFDLIDEHQQWTKDSSSFQLSPFEVDSSGNKFDLTFYLKEGEDQVSINLAYNISLFGEERIQRMAKHLTTQLDNLLEAPHQSISHSSYLPQKEYQQLVADFNDTTIPYDSEASMHHAFEKQAKATPDAPALRQDGLTMTYGQLNRKANQIARYLQQLGVEQGDKVGLVSDRNFDMIVGLFAILKAGGTYVPIDPEYPKDRQEYIIDNSGIRFLITDSAELAKEAQEVLPKLNIASIEEDNTYKHYASGNLDVEISSHELAYIIYTSGSTGRPKGVMIEHHSAVNLISWVNNTFEVGQDDRLLLLTSMCFDLSVYDIFGILSVGGTLIIAHHEEVRDYKALKHLLLEEKITFWDTVPTTLDYLVSELERYEPDFVQNDLRVAFLSGDWIPVNLPARTKALFPNVAFTSLGGATEGTVWSNYFPVEAVGEDWTSIPYGKPIANNFFYILDANRTPLPQGVTGELYIGGVGVARGYMNDEVKTKAAFVPDPFFPQYGGQMYRTGDLGRMLPSGNMEFLGRKDHQVKIRGFRVELGEIENVLSKHPYIESALIIAIKKANSNTQIAAYYTANQEHLSITALQEHLANYLPDYMIPAYFIQLEAFPLNSNGKIDRKALPQPDSSLLQAAVTFLEPSSTNEKHLATIWRDILGLERVSADDNFFQIGGNSLSAAQLMARIDKELDTSIKLRNIFLHPTLNGLAQTIDAIQWNKESKADEFFDTSNEIII